MMVESILKDATQNYTPIKVADKKWISTIDAGASSFTAELSKVQCYNCKKHGHIKRDCPEATKKQRSEWKEMPCNHTSGGGRGGGRGRKTVEVVTEEAIIKGTRKTMERGDQNIVPLVSSVTPKLEHSTDNHANGGGSGKKSTSTPTPKKSNNGDFAKNVALAIQGIANAGIKDDDDDDAPAAFSLLFNGIQKVLKG
eukprot:scaffold61789_cov36-Attheya_sp.AAC.1